ncbi:hypothetical protein FBQ84_04910 [Ignavibacteria bacterium CHB1]|jgi:D-3-phosphoglycerate dehydrogenase|nr:MAG: hypothetical protein EDM69_05040 [Chlorobiota bacterium]KXK06151.1 MAG: D-3-phosphoglycerate dehydrogenase [Chlorobi bacterium OLB4]MBV6398579.1 Hydroxypyruvate reductase [Ignavibacteria bacterium]MCC6885813.1 hypothetical protein [Ignavibacteriales bacterium]MCE7952992.1 hypothetical protein [Chlorobi bacterium CHB7]MDL1887170.1 hypothetical protein [Ignavibacteria bacterium CHB1]OQY78063.1 MAG: hypothetical protein B6D43_05995 [Ignavibacteriales bacterium UTCHB1]RIK49814.1 MAG: hyp
MGKMRWNVLIADEFSESHLNKFHNKKFCLTYKPGISNDEILSGFGNTDVLIIKSTRKINPDFVRKLSPDCIATVSRGVDHIDLRGLTRNKPKVIHCESGNAISTAEHTIGLIMAVMKNYKLSFELAKSEFVNSAFSRNEISGKVIGIIGFGKVGQLVYRYSEVFGMNRMVNELSAKVRKENPGVYFVSLNKLLLTADIVTIHIPLNNRNRRFFDRQQFALMRPDSILINTSRGEVINEKLLIKSLTNGNIKAAGIDVVCNEPFPEQSLFNVKNLTITNHIAGKTTESKLRMEKEIVNQVLAFCE